MQSALPSCSTRQIWEDASMMLCWSCCRWGRPCLLLATQLCCIKRQMLVEGLASCQAAFQMTCYQPTVSTNLPTAGRGSLMHFTWLGIWPATEQHLSDSRPDGLGTCLPSCCRLTPSS